MVCHLIVIEFYLSDICDEREDHGQRLDRLIIERVVTEAKLGVCGVVIVVELAKDDRRSFQLVAVVLEDVLDALGVPFDFRLLCTYSLASIKDEARPRKSQ